MCPDLVAQLATLQNINKNGISVNLYDSPGHFFKLKDIAKDAKGISGKICSIEIINALSEGLKECDLLIYLDHLQRFNFLNFFILKVLNFFFITKNKYPCREELESTSAWLLRSHETIKELSKQIVLHASPHMKVIFCSMDPTCLYANALIKETKLNPNNVVVVSAHYGLELLYNFTKSLNVSIKEISCPPVWGFLGNKKKL